MAWVALVAAGLFEMFGVAMISKLHRDRNWQAVALLVLGFGGSLALLAYAMQSLSMGVAYAIWTGIGACGGAMVGMFVYDESTQWQRIALVALILGAAVGLKLVS